MCRLFDMINVCYYLVFILTFFFFFKQKTAYEMRISDWSTDVCSSDLRRCERDEYVIATGECTAVAIDDAIEAWQRLPVAEHTDDAVAGFAHLDLFPGRKIGRASCRERVCQYV